jgi:hypothetical protein
MDVTAIVLNWRRPANVRLIVPALRRQTAQPWIVLADNAGSYTAEAPDQQPYEAWTMGPVNVGPILRVLVAYNADTEWLYFQDDDLMPKDDAFIADLITLAEEKGSVITGVFGRTVYRTPPHYQHPDTYGWTNMVKTRVCVMQRKDLGRVRIPADKAAMRRADDLWLNLETSGGENVHYVDHRLRHRLTELPTWGNALSASRQHYSEREAFCARWWREHDGL